MSKYSIQGNFYQIEHMQMSNSDIFGTKVDLTSTLDSRPVSNSDIFGTKVSEMQAEIQRQIQAKKSYSGPASNSDIFGTKVDLTSTLDSRPASNSDIFGTKVDLKQTQAEMQAEIQRQIQSQAIIPNTTYRQNTTSTPQPISYGQTTTSTPQMQPTSYGQNTTSATQSQILSLIQQNIKCNDKIRLLKKTIDDFK
jgi:hypothetical protein